MSTQKFVTGGDSNLSKRKKMAGADQRDVVTLTKNAAKPSSEAGDASTSDAIFIETDGDLFSCPESESLAHCISADCAMGKGIAVIFKKKFGGVQELKKQDQKTGGLSFLRRGKRYVYYLVTKETVWQKPTYTTLESSLRALRYHCETHRVSGVSMPRIGCGLDGLQWGRVAELIRTVFRGSPVAVTVYTL